MQPKIYVTEEEMGYISEADTEGKLDYSVFIVTNITAEAPNSKYDFERWA